MVVTEIVVQMARDEWSSHENGRIMERLAREQFKASDEPGILIVTVQEHGGWWLRYVWDTEKQDVACWGTANDLCRHFPDITDAIRARFADATLGEYRTIRRDELIPA